MRKLSQSVATDRAWIELDLERLALNVQALRTLLPSGTALMPAVKANAYGHGAILVALALNQLGIAAFCVATAEEGVELRRGGVQGEILVLGYTHPDRFPLLADYALTQTVVDTAYAKRLSGFGRRLQVQIAVDTGMHRIGERWEDTERICAVFGMERLQVTGIFTHLSVCDSPAGADRLYTLQQAERFYLLLRRLAFQGIQTRFHLLSSSGILHYPELGGDYVRAGIALYGVLSRREELQRCPVALAPVLSVKARVVMTRTLYRGESLGYGRTCTAASDRKIAVLSIGYGDGIPRELSCGKGQALLHGQPVPIAGRICMDQMMVDITGVDHVQSGDVAVLLGQSGGREITPYDLAETSGSITNEVLCRLGSRLPRLNIHVD